MDGKSVCKRWDKRARPAGSMCTTAKREHCSTNPNPSCHRKTSLLLRMRKAYALLPERRRGVVVPCFVPSRDWCRVCCCDSHAHPVHRQIGALETERIHHATTQWQRRPTNLGGGRLNALDTKTGKYPVAEESGTAVGRRCGCHKRWAGVCW